MQYIADFHLHSHYSIATSKELDPEHLFASAAVKGINLVGTGDFTHPGWREELSEKLVPAGDGAGLLRLEPELERQVRAGLPKPVAAAEVRFLLSAEISSIYKKMGRARKVHNLVLMKDLAGAAKLSAALEKIGNIRSDGRPILGLDSRDLLEICLETDEEVCFIPAHIWTPHFSVFGSKSGFDRMEDCYGDLTGRIYAVETGLSSDPPMNWRLSVLDSFALVSNSDAHSPGKLAREANLFDDELSYHGMTSALKSRDPGRFLGTLEFNPEEGKYHYDGHRACGVRLTPEETRELGGRCPECGRPLTCGVLGRVVELADRPAGVHPEAARPFERLVPLVEVLAEVLSSGPATRKVSIAYRRLVDRLGPELVILRRAPLEELAAAGGEVLAEALRRVRAGELKIEPGYDGEYGKVRIFDPGELQSAGGQVSMFPGLGPEERHRQAAAGGPGHVSPKMARDPAGDGKKTTGRRSALPAGETAAESLNDRQMEAVTCSTGPVAVAAGPGTGKTRCLASRVAWLVRERGMLPENILAATFTNRAAAEMRGRISRLLGDARLSDKVRVGTFHSFCLGFLRENEPEPGRRLVLEEESQALLAAALEQSRPLVAGVRLRELAGAVGRAKALGLTPENFRGPEDIRTAFTAYARTCRDLGVRDFDDLVLDTLALLKNDAVLLDELRRQYPALLVDEFQDVNPAQYELVRLLAGDGVGLFVIGDPNQSIYGFRGADCRVFERLGDDYPSLKKITLELGYRCSPAVARASGVLIAKGGTPYTPPAAAAKGAEPIRLVRCPSETSEAIAVVREIGRLVGGTGMLSAHAGPAGADPEGQLYSFADCAVVARTGALCEELERCFAVEGIPCRVRGAKSYLRRDAVCRLLAFIRLAVDPRDDFRFPEALRLVGCSLPGGVLDRLRAAARDSGRALLAQLKVEVSRSVPLPEGLKGAAEFLLVLEKYRRRLETLKPSDLVGELAQTYLPSCSEQDKAALEALQRTAVQFDGVGEFLENISLRAEGDHERPGRGRAEPRAEAVALMTMHAAKGLEFPVVFICGVEQGMIPYTWRESDPDEERRLFYVAMTRAAQRLYLTSAARRQVRGRTIEAGWSPLVADLPAELLEDCHPALPRTPAQGRQLDLF
ncbi:MAG: UvrD-helicase domain-containing protein [Candidatus Glassbacteria bacterium]|nr:UvrD-helicase domain-containing protein [Candidatus Glassbacteria bacterium]